MPKWLQYLFRCLSFDAPLPNLGDVRHGPVWIDGKPMGDYFDRFTDCKICGKPIHLDMHQFGEGGWRHL